jgi:hypothetical protein
MECEVKSEWIYTSTLPIRLHEVCKDTCTFPLTTRVRSMWPLPVTFPYQNCVSTFRSSHTAVCYTLLGLRYSA